MEFTADIVASHVSNNTVALIDVSDLIKNVHAALQALEPGEEPEPTKPIVSVRASVKPDYLVCLSCGAKKKTLKRHLQVAHGLMPNQYRAKYDLAKTYPIVAARYAERRSELAKAIGLGRKSGRAKNRTSKK